MLRNCILFSDVQASIIKRRKEKKPKSPTNQRNLEIIPILIRNKEDQFKLRLLKLQVKDKEGEFKIKLGFGDNLLPKLSKKDILLKSRI